MIWFTWYTHNTYFIELVIIQKIKKNMKNIILTNDRIV